MEPDDHAHPAWENILGLADLAASHGQEVSFPRRHVIFGHDRWGDRLYIIRSGKVKLDLYARAHDREILLTILGPSDMFGELSLFDPGPQAATATALTEVRAVSIHRAAVRERISTRPEFAEHMLSSLARQVRRTYSTLTDLVLTDVPSRVAKSLLQLAAQFGHTEDGVLRVQHDLTPEELADHIGATLDAVNKALSVFTRRGWLRVDHKSVLILEPDRLRRHATR
ncbi:transcriptional regulator, Crp/Fnr family [Lentzea xinjiangensis]|uniref:Transcriptional regulator, Crp/Fnr family n=1 Tax=Lentzea xinjiangensis TaxID=402600 RepID=A0A1H9W5K6_9PSEU|nr:Crp/Fnr family transcriptional regulator [Lentzea xinjiangensis]SES28947.1 transcriptional regulator, Crp/Fnr family [Lentzea xinjiangensis]